MSHASVGREVGPTLTPAAGRPWTGKQCKRVEGGSTQKPTDGPWATPAGFHVRVGTCPRAERRGGPASPALGLRGCCIPLLGQSLCTSAQGGVQSAAEGHARAAAPGSWLLSGMCARLAPHSYSFSLYGSDGLCPSRVLKPAGSSSSGGLEENGMLVANRGI